MPKFSEEAWADFQSERNALRDEVHDLRALRNAVSLLVAGAIREGFTSLYQKEALTYAFCHLIGEYDERLALVMAEVPPKTFYKGGQKTLPVRP